jgi:acetyl esterase/lipase
MHLLRSALFEDGYAFAAIEYTAEYRSERAEVMLDNIVTAFEKLAADADRLGFDRDRIVLVGNGAGGHFVTLLGTDPTLLAATPFFSAVRGVVSVNGHGFDIGEQIAEATPFRAEAFRKAFGSDPGVHARLSPVTYFAPPNAPAFLFQAVADHPHIQNQAMSMYRLLKRAGAKSAYAPLPPWRRHGSRSYYGWEGGDGYLHLSQFLLAVVSDD